MTSRRRRTAETRRRVVTRQALRLEHGLPAWSLYGSRLRWRLRHRPVRPGSPDPPRSTEAGGAARAIVGVKIYDTDRDLAGALRRVEGARHQHRVRERGAGLVGMVSGRWPRRTTPTSSSSSRCFFAPEELARGSRPVGRHRDGERAKDDWVEFACPSRARSSAQRRDRGGAGDRPPAASDGLSIDFIRDFVFWEMVGPDRDPADLPDTCYCVHCLQAFATSLGVPAFSIHDPQPQRRRPGSRPTPPMSGSASRPRPSRRWRGDRRRCARSIRTF